MASLIHATLPLPPTKKEWSYGIGLVVHQIKCPIYNSNNNIVPFTSEEGMKYHVGSNPGILKINLLLPYIRVWLMLAA